MTDADYIDPGYQARKASGYVETPPPRYSDPPRPVDWPPGPPPVRCIDCAHVGTMRFGFCAIASKRASGVARWRRCGSFEARAVVKPQESPADPPLLDPVRSHYREPIERVRRRLVELKMLDRLQELVDIGGGNVGVRFRPDLSDLETAEVHGVIATAMVAAAMATERVQPEPQAKP